MTLNGYAYELPMWEHPTSGTESGYMPTPRASMGNPAKNRVGVDSEEYRHNLEEYLGGKPNPDYAEWMMGWPIGWTNVIKPLGMDKFQEWLRQHGDF